jgi:hypothetical protein
MANPLNIVINFNNSFENDPCKIFPTLPTPAIRFLGVYFDPQHNLKHHIQPLVNKLSPYYFLRSAKNILTFNALKSIVQRKLTGVEVALIDTVGLSAS